MRQLHLSHVFAGGLLLQELSLPVAGTGVSSRPQMGFGAYNAFGVHITDQKTKETADAIVELGLRDLGYSFLNLDDQWQAEDRDADTGRLRADSDKFPHGILPVAEYVHSKGLKFGIYSDAAPITCSGHLPGHLGNEELDAQTFVDWGVDYLKSDNCFPQGKDKTNVDKYYVNFAKSVVGGAVVQTPAERTRYLPMIKALEARRSQRNITLELCLYGWDHVEEWAATSGDHLWRVSADIKDTWDSIMFNLDCLDSDRFFKSSGPTTGWAYADGLQVGHSLSLDEYRSQFALWCAVKSPLMIGFDLRGKSRDDASVQIVSNRGLIAVNQDALGVPARCVKGCTLSVAKLGCGHWWGSSLGAEESQPPTGAGAMESSADVAAVPGTSKRLQIWSGPLSGSAHVVLVVNRADTEKDVDFDWAKDAKVPAGEYALFDLWDSSGSNAPCANISVPGAFRGDALASHANRAWRLFPLGSHERMLI